MRPRLALAGLSTLAFGLALWLTLGPLDAIPHLSDEVAYTLQARLFAHGLRVGPPADNPTMLAYPFWQTSPHSFSIFPPGWPALLALGEAIGLPWLVNPLLAAALPPLTFLLAQTLTERPKAWLAAAIVALSPGVLILAASRMAHTSVLVALLGLAVVVARREDPLWAWALAGLGAAYTVLARPFDAATVAGPLLALGLWRAPDWPRRTPLLLLPALASALTLWDNHQLTGHALSFPVNPWYEAWTDFQRPGCNALGFGPQIGCHPTLGSLGHTPQKAAKLAFLALARMDRLTLGLPGGLLLALPGLLLLRPRRLSAALLGLVIGGYALYWSPGAAYGARFYHALYLLLPIWLAVGLHRFLGRGAWLLVLLMPLAGLNVVQRDLSEDYWCVDGELRSLLKDNGVTEGVVFLQARGNRKVAWPALGVESFTCDAMLEAGEGFALDDPTHRRGGLQVRHALPDAESTSYFLDHFHPGAPAWLVQHDIATDSFHLIRLR